MARKTLRRVTNNELATWLEQAAAALPNVTDQSRSIREATCVLVDFYAKRMTFENVTIYGGRGLTPATLRILAAYLRGRTDAQIARVIEGELERAAVTTEVRRERSRKSSARQRVAHKKPSPEERHADREQAAERMVRFMKAPRPLTESQQDPDAILEDILRRQEDLE